MVRLFSLVLGSFETTAAEDVTAHAAAAPDAQDIRMAITFRLEKKRTLVDAIRSLAVLVKVRFISQQDSLVIVKCVAPCCIKELPQLQ